jgi:hypothetical protein
MILRSSRRSSGCLNLYSQMLAGISTRLRSCTDASVSLENVGFVAAVYEASSPAHMFALRSMATAAALRLLRLALVTSGNGGPPAPTSVNSRRLPGSDPYSGIRILYCCPVRTVAHDSHCSGLHLQQRRQGSTSSDWGGGQKSEANSEP